MNRAFTSLSLVFTVISGSLILCSTSVYAHSTKTEKIDKACSSQPTLNTAREKTEESIRTKLSIKPNQKFTQKPGGEKHQDCLEADKNSLDNTSEKSEK